VQGAFSPIEIGTACVGQRDGHHLINRPDRPARLIEMGSHAETENGEYSDIDMIFVARDGVESYFHKNGDPY